MPSQRIARVALDVPVPALFDYRLPGDVIGSAGQRVLVPFRGRTAVGLICATAEHSEVPEERLRDVLQVYQDEPPVPDDVLALLQFCSDYYHHPIGEAIFTALPQRLRRTTVATLRAPRFFALTDAGLSAPLPDVRATLQRRLLLAFRERQVMSRTEIGTLASGAPRLLPAFAAAGWIVAVDGPASGSPVAAKGPTLTAAQAQAVEAIEHSAGGFRCWLLHGVTGSGKTEVYLHVIAGALARGQQVLVLVPEINLTPQIEQVFRDRLPDVEMVSLHSGLSAGERAANWRRAQTGTASLVLGTRLATFTPLPRLGLIVVDEEHDGSFKQEDGLRYHARDVAVFRAKQRAVPIVLGSATPSLETYSHAASGRYGLLALPERVGASLPRVRLLDVRDERMQDGCSAQLLERIGEVLQRREQVLVFINRRGYAPVLVCHACGWAAACTRCSARLVLHLRDRRLRCHHCGHDERVVAACPECGNQDLAPMGSGTQRIEESLAAAFPAARVLRIDRDSTRRRFAFRDMRSRIERREVDILVGTQLLAKGHDFPHLALVGVLNADGALYSADYRASEGLFALLMQVAGRAGRGAATGEVLVQTEFPDHPLYAALVRHEFAGFAETLLAEREQAGFPPYVFQAVLRAEAPQIDAALAFLARARDLADDIARGVSVYDPVPAAMVRVAGRDRAHLLIQSASRKSLQRFLTEWNGRIAAVPGRVVRWALDVDPLHV